MTRIFVSICDPFFQYDNRSYIYTSHRIDYKTNGFGYSVAYIFYFMFFNKERCKLLVYLLKFCLLKYTKVSCSNCVALIRSSLASSCSICRLIDLAIFYRTLL
jgi:hypothetical protein